jgi:hypothetical protein
MRLLKDLTIDELKRVYLENNKLNELVFDSMMDDANFWVNEYLNCFEHGALLCEIGYPGNWLTVRDNEKFVGGCKTVQRNFELFNRETFEKVLYCGKLFARWWIVQDEKNARRIDERIEELCEEIGDALLHRLVDEYEAVYNEGFQIDYFLNVWLDNIDADNYYIDKNYILYQNISYTKCYA